MLSPQSQSIYKILLNSRCSLSAKQLANQMRIVPSLVYRLIQPLIEIGIVNRISGYPYKFNAKSKEEGLSLFLLHQHEWFYKNFLSYTENNLRPSEKYEIQFSFIQSRDELMNESAKEISKATKSIDLLRSGHEIPADVMLATKDAKKRSVITRMLIQDYSSQNADQVAYWKQNGILVRKTGLRHLRLMIYDASTVYFMSYKHNDSAKDLGLKIHYPPFAFILSQLFDTWWKEAERV